MMRGLFVLLSLTLLLTACGQKKDEATSVSSEQGHVSTVTSSSSSAISQKEDEASAASEPAELMDRGSYFSVQGRYGEVIIVNKKHPLAADYAPGEDPTALAAFQELVADMQGLGFAISDSYSGFRSYDYQASLYASYVANDGQVEADRYSARPGHSEHQTGLAFDLLDSWGQLLEEPEASQWLADNAHRYGFVVRYLPGKEHITGYMAESWHVRYIGQEATAIYQSGLTLEEYYGVPGGDYE